MGSIFLGVLATGTKAELQQQLSGILANLPEEVAPAPAPPPAPTPAPPPPVTGGPLNGPIVMGAVTGEWSGGVPGLFYITDNPTDRATCSVDLWNAIVQAFPQSEWVRAVYFAFTESRFAAGAHNPSSAEDSWGVFQINRNAWPQFSQQQLVTFTGNAGAARVVWDAQGWAGGWVASAKMLGVS